MGRRAGAAPDGRRQLRVAAAGGAIRLGPSCGGTAAGCRRTAAQPRLRQDHRGERADTLRAPAGQQGSSSGTQAAMQPRIEGMGVGQVRARPAAGGLGRAEERSPPLSTHCSSKRACRVKVAHNTRTLRATMHGGGGVLTGVLARSPRRNPIRGAVQQAPACKARSPFLVVGQLGGCRAPIVPQNGRIGTPTPACRPPTSPPFSTILSMLQLGCPSFRPAVPMQAGRPLPCAPCLCRGNCLCLASTPGAHLGASGACCWTFLRRARLLAVPCCFARCCVRD